MAESLRSNTEELRELLLRALSARSEAPQIVELQHAGLQVAEQIMAAGQEVGCSFDPITLVSPLPWK